MTLERIYFIRKRQSNEYSNKAAFKSPKSLKFHKNVNNNFDMFFSKDERIFLNLAIEEALDMFNTFKMAKTKTKQTKSSIFRSDRYYQRSIDRSF